MAYRYGCGERVAAMGWGWEGEVRRRQAHVGRGFAGVRVKGVEGWGMKDIRVDSRRHIDGGSTAGASEPGEGMPENPSRICPDSA